MLWTCIKHDSDPDMYKLLAEPKQFSSAQTSAENEVDIRRYFHHKSFHPFGNFALAKSGPNFQKSIGGSTENHGSQAFKKLRGNTWVSWTKIKIKGENC